MKCENYKELFTGSLNGELTRFEKIQLDNHLADCPACKEELAVMQSIWSEMATIEVPEPSVDLQVSFRAMLNDFEQENPVKTSQWQLFMDKWQQLWQSQPQWPVAYSLAIVVICLSSMFWLVQSRDDQKEELSSLSSQVHDLKQTMMLALLENPSASERMKAVNYTSELKNADAQIINALLVTLNNDQNVNVRLSTLDALGRLSNYPEVRQGLVQSITQQSSPIMQSAIADVMLDLQEKGSVKPLQQLLKQKNLDPGIREKITQTITKLI